jgi:hypothetical protein
LIFSNEPEAAWDNKTLLVILKLLQLDGEIEVVLSNDENLLKKSFTGRFPLLE